MIVNVFEFSLFLKNGLKWLLMAKNDSICVENIQNMRMAKLLQKNLRKICFYLNILDKYSQLPRYS